MYISNKSIQRISRIYNEQNKIDRTAEKKPEYGDKVTLSTEGKQLQALLQKASAPEPSAKAQALKNAITSGTYHVKGEDIAASIIKYYRQRF
ncbi:MAG: flagellar biosynthesis anti-sigma factor FlgM [Firmicutes bacterium]|jgi:flagellar biosynthesis anti-sigma factor FlgM|nr:flagellar biosynthesis anti-sigma factor FlgM [Bacillota bacterium]